MVRARVCVHIYSWAVNLAVPFIPVDLIICVQAILVSGVCPLAQKTGTRKQRSVSQIILFINNSGVMASTSQFSEVITFTAVPSQRDDGGVAISIPTVTLID